MSLLAGMFVVGALLSPPPPEVIRRAVDEVYADPRVQRTLPDAPDAVEAREGEPSRLGRSGGGAALPAFSGVATVLLWTVVAVAAGAVVAAAVASAVRARRGAAVVSAPAAPAAAPPPGAPPLDDADRLAAAGRFDEAVHVLLLRAIRGLSIAGRAPPDPWTSREAVAHATLSDPRRGAVAVLVEVVERSLFGGRPVDAAAYGAARAAFDRFHAPAAGP